MRYALLIALTVGCGAARVRGGDEHPNLAVTDPPAAKVSRTEAIEKAVAFLVENQNADGSFGSHDTARWYEITADVPGSLMAFQAATTALCWMGLRAAPDQPEASRKAQEKALAWIVKNVRVKRATGGECYNTWSFGFGLQALARALSGKAPGASPKAIHAEADAIVKDIGRYQTPDGGWGYYDFATRTARPSWSTSFSTATMVVALQEARGAGIDVPQSILDKAVRNLEECRLPSGAYLYGTYLKYRPDHPVNMPEGSCMRTQACNLALYLCGKLKKDDLRAGLRQLVENQRFAIAGLHRPVPHESYFAVSGYFFLYGHAYASMVLERLGPEDRANFGPTVMHGVLKTRDPDGSFWDYPLYSYHKPYGTAFALLAMSPLGDAKPAD